VRSVGALFEGGCSPQLTSARHQAASTEVGLNMHRLRIEATDRTDSTDSSWRAAAGATTACRVSTHPEPARASQARERGFADYRNLQGSEAKEELASGLELGCD